MSAFHLLLNVFLFMNPSAHELTNQLGDNDLNGLIFSETPWLVQNGPNVLLNQWLDARSGWELSQARLAAMGYDSVDLLQRLPIMQRMPGTQWKGLRRSEVENQVGIDSYNGLHLKREYHRARGAAQCRKTTGNKAESIASEFLAKHQIILSSGIIVLTVERLT